MLKSTNAYVHHMIPITDRLASVETFAPVVGR